MAKTLSDKMAIYAYEQGRWVSSAELANHLGWTLGRVSSLSHNITRNRKYTAERKCEVVGSRKMMYLKVTSIHGVTDKVDGGGCNALDFKGAVDYMLHSKDFVFGGLSSIEMGGVRL